MNYIQFAINSLDNTSGIAAGMAQMEYRELLARITALETAGRHLVNNLPESAIEEAREVWQNTNTRIVLDCRREFAALLGETK